jgi:hypothetical protein
MTMMVPKITTWEYIKHTHKQNNAYYVQQSSSLFLSLKEGVQLRRHNFINQTNEFQYRFEL